MSSVFDEMNVLQKLIAFGGAVAVAAVAVFCFVPFHEPAAVQATHDSSELASATASTGGGAGGSGGAGGVIDVTVYETTATGEDFIDESEDPMMDSPSLRCPDEPHCELGVGGSK